MLRFDFTGLGSSEGEFANTNFTSNVADLVSAADFLRQQHQAPKLLIGHSLGGAAVQRAVLRAILCCVTDAADRRTRPAQSSVPRHPPHTV